MKQWTEAGAIMYACSSSSAWVHMIINSTSESWGKNDMLTHVNWVGEYYFSHSTTDQHMNAWKFCRIQSPLQKILKN